MSKIAFIDLLFNWPPDGGARADLKEVMSRLSESHPVTLLVPTYHSGTLKEIGIEYLPQCSQEDLPELYTRVDICVVPSLWREPFGIAAVEAMAAGKPVVAPRVGGLEDIVEDGVTGLLMEPGNAAELADKIERILDNPSMRQNMGRAGRQTAIKSFAWDVIMESYYLNIFNSG